MNTLMNIMSSKKSQKMFTQMMQSMGLAKKKKNGAMMSIFGGSLAAIGAAVYGVIRYKGNLPDLKPITNMTTNNLMQNMKNQNSNR